MRRPDASVQPSPHIHPGHGEAIMTDTVRNSQSLPPPLELREGDRTIGVIDGDVVRFHGFDSRESAAQAAAVAHDAMRRHLARAPRPVEGTVLFDRPNGRSVASVLRSSPNGRTGAHTEEFSFEIRVPPPNDELRMRGMAYAMHHALRSSGVAWPLVRPAKRETVSPVEAPRAMPLVAAILVAVLAVVVGFGVVLTAAPQISAPAALLLLAGVVAASLGARTRVRSFA
jgi:hypothetical protein